MKVTAILATCGRHTLLERSVGMYIQQDYTGESALLIYNNSNISLNLDPNLSLPPGKEIFLFNMHLDSKTGERYNNLGSIYNDVLQYVPEDTEIIYHNDDDDLFLPNHISEGVKGFKRGSKLAYKPAKSYFRHAGGVTLMANTLEPSIFVDYE